MRTKKITAILLTIIAGIFLTSCYRSDSGLNAELGSDARKVGFEDLNNKIAEFEKEFGFTELNTRASFWQKLGWIAGADAIGAAIGGKGGLGMAIILGAAASIAASIAALIVGEDSFAWNSTKATGELQEIIMALGNEGLEHNQILQSFFNMDNPVFDDMAIEDISEYIIQNVYEIVRTNYAIDLPSKGECMELSSNQTMLPYDSLDELAFKCIQSHPESADEIAVIKHCVQTYASLEDITDVAAYSKGLSTIIEEAEIPIASKKQLKSGASVAAFSRLYWEDKIN